MPSADAQTTYTWSDPDGGNWGNSAMWSPVGVPNAVGDKAIFSNIGQTGNHDVALNGNFTVGSIDFKLEIDNTTGRHTINQFVANPGDLPTGMLIFDEVGAGPATINVTANPETQNLATIVAPIRLDDNLVVTVPDYRRGANAGALRLHGAITGTGGLTRNSGPDLRPGADDLLNLEHPGDANLPEQNGVSINTYSGPTILNGGRTRIAESRAPENSISFTINGNSQLEPTVDGTYSFGAGVLVLNPGPGNLSDSGVIRPARRGTTAAGQGSVITITNDIQLQANSKVHSQRQGTPATPTLGGITFAGVISNHASATGSALQFGVPTNGQTGEYVIQKDNTYTGGSTLFGGTLRVTDAVDANASLGAGNVTIQADAYADMGGNAFARLVIEEGVLDAIANDAVLTLAGGDVAGVADDGYALLETGINEIVGGLVLGATAQTLAGTYGSTSSGADFANDEYFSGPGVIELVLPAMDNADFDDDGDVDGADFLTWQRGLGQGGQMDNSNGDADGSGTIDQDDLVVLRDQFGNFPSVGAAAAIPEPTTIALAAMGLAAACFAARRRK